MTDLRDYKDITKITEGGFGAIFCAVHGPSGTKVAIKQILSEHLQNETIRSLFLQEARILSDLRHENIVKVREFFEDGADLLIPIENEPIFLRKNDPPKLINSASSFSSGRTFPE